MGSVGLRSEFADVISDMIDAVKAKGIRVFLYSHPWQPVGDDQNKFINELYAETIDRYGSRIDGLWIDENQINGDQDSLVDYTRLIHHQGPQSGSGDDAEWRADLYV